MLIVGAKGFAVEVLEIQHQLNDFELLAFYDDVNQGLDTLLYGVFPIIKTKHDAKNYLKTIDNRFTLGIGGTAIRNNLSNLFLNLGGNFVSTISPYAHIGHFNVEIGAGCNIMTGTVITNDIHIGRGVLINLNCTIGHNSKLGDFVELSPGVHISGRCKIGDCTTIGTNSVVVPNIEIGKNCIIGAGSVILKDVPDNSVVVGVPGKVIKKNL